VTIIELCMSISFMIVGALAVSETFQMNTYIFTIVGSITSVVVVLFVHFTALLKMWARSSMMSHEHMLIVTLPVASGIILLGISFLILGVWVSDNCTCCNTADCQPDPLDFKSVARYFIAWAVLVVMNAIWAYTIVQALLAHMYPEMKVPITSDTSRTKMPAAFQEHQKRADEISAKLVAGANVIVNNPSARRPNVYD
jgi:hypothetical protein